MTDLERHPHDLTIAEAGAALRNGSLSCAALTESVLERLEQTEPLLNAYITVTADLARQQAAQLDDELRDGRDRGPLHGIPIGLKDLVDTAGIPTTGGSGFLRDRVPETDATVWTKLQQAGAVLPGKLNLHEFAFGTTSRNPHYGAVHNPWDTERSPGGSSGGSGAAVAVGSALAAIGSDTGGSIRIPASLCGVVGLMGTYGRVSRAGVLPLSWTLDHVGPLARTVEDAAMFLDAIAGYDPLDPGLGRPRGRPIQPQCSARASTACESASPASSSGQTARKMCWPTAKRHSTTYNGWARNSSKSSCPCKPTADAASPSSPKPPPTTPNGCASAATNTAISCRASRPAWPSAQSITSTTSAYGASSSTKR